MVDNPRRTDDWFENEEFWLRAYAFLFPEERFEAAARGLDTVTAALGVSSGARVLDLCCGPGRFAIPLAEHGLRITAVDRTQLYLDRLSARAADAEVQIETVREDMRQFRRESAFDGAINMYTSFGYFESRDDDRRVLENVYASLKPGGRLLMEMAAREIVARVFQHHDWVEADGRFLLEEHCVDPDFGGTHDRWIVLDEQGRIEFNWALRLYTGTELCDLLKSVGFSEATPFGNFEGAPYDNTANRLCIIARK